METTENQRQQNDGAERSEWQACVCRSLHNHHFFHPSKECALVKRYLDSHYSDDINLEQLASLSHLNKYYLSHEFTRYYGISPISYLTHRRIEVCKNLLENTAEMGVRRLAELAGLPLKGKVFGMS